MKKEELLKLAEIAGVEVRDVNENLIWIQEDGHDCTPWAPDVNLDEAFECLNSLGKDYDITCIDKVYEVTISPEYPDEVSFRGPKLAEAICEAVLKAVRG
jgi:hypothetical protein